MPQTKSILLIEDNEYDQFFFTKALREIENAVLYHIANNGQEALDRLHKSPVLPDLIFTDINMPVMDGVECLTQIVTNEEIKHIPVVILSTDTHKLELVRKLGAKAFIKKTSDYTVLLKRLEHVINLDFTVDISAANQTFQTALSDL